MSFSSVENIEIEIQNEEHEAPEEETVVDNGKFYLVCMFEGICFVNIFFLFHFRLCCMVK